MGKKKVINEQQIKDMVLPVVNDLLGIVVKLLGFDRVFVKFRDVVLVSPWDFQSDKRGDFIWRYTKTQAEWL